MSTASTDLVNIADSNKTIPTLSTGGLTDLTFETNKWGYKKNRLTDNYNPFPATSTLLQNNTRTNADTANMRFASKVDYLQASGTYNTTINFQLVDNPPIYMQDVTPSMCTTTLSTVVDKRDGKSYAIKQLPDGNCWMVQNLNFSGSSSDSAGTMTLSTETSNVQKDITISYGDLTDGNSYGQARIHSSGNDVNGTWYNYAAATAMNVTGSSNTVNAASDICPRGWKLPSFAETSALTALIENTPEAFNAVVSGYYNNGDQTYTLGGYWWASTAYDATTRRYTGYSSTANTIKSTSQVNRQYGLSVRCILDTRTLSDITYMQEMTPTVAKNTAANATKTLTDIRDSKTYSVRKIGTDIWMTKNLAIGCNGTGSTYGSSVSQKTLTYTTSNTEPTYNYTTPTALLTAASASTETADLSNGRIQCDSTYGGYYNYVTTTAGTITGITNTNDVTQDICPSGWQLPALTQLTNITSELGPTAPGFNPAIGSRYNRGIRSDYEGISGLWWGSTVNKSNGNRYFLLYRVTPTFSYGSTTGRHIGMNVRCTAKI